MKKLITLTLLMSFYMLSFHIYAIEEEGGVYWIFQKYAQNPQYGTFLASKDNGLEFQTLSIQDSPSETLRSSRKHLWSIEPLKDGYYRICSNTKVGIRCLEAFPSMEGKSLVKLNQPSSHQNQLWAIKPFDGEYSICSDTLYFGLRCLGVRDNEIVAEKYQKWQFLETYYRFSNLEKSDKQQNIRFNDLEKSNKRQNIRIDSLDSSNQQQDIRLEALEDKLSNQQNIRPEILEEKLHKLTRTDELQANDLSSFGNRLRNLEQLNEQVNLFRSSFVSGAAYSLIPEVIKDGIEFSGYPKKAADVAAMVAQGAMVAYNTVDPLNPSSYASTITGMAAKYGSGYLGYSNDTSIIVGSTVAIVTTVLSSPEETTLDCITGCAIALAGSYAGSTLALKAKSWIYEFWHNEQITSLVAQAKSLTTQASSWAFERISFYGLWSSGDNTSQKDLASIISEKNQKIEELEKEIRLLTKEE